MNFKDLITRYKEGTASEEEKRIVQNELEKYESIEHYFSDQLSDELFFSKDQTEESVTKDVEETASIKKVVNRKLAKVVLVSVLSVILLYVGIFYGLSSIVDSLHYDPTSITAYEGQEYPESDFSFDMKAYVSLNIPGHTLSSFTYEEPQGFGVYETGYFLRDLFTNDEQRHSIDIHRGIPRNFHDGIFSYTNRFDIWSGFDDIYSPVTDDDSGMSEEYREGDRQRKNDITLNYLEELNPLSYISMSIVFEEDLTMEELYDLSREVQMLDFKWVGVRTIEPGTRWSENQPNHLIGFNPNMSDEPQGNMKPDPEVYPLFNLSDVFDRSPSSENPFPEGYETHFESRLTYLSHRDEFVEIIDYNPHKTEFYDHALNYINENGVETYGVLIYGTAEDFMENIGSIPFNSLYINEIQSSSPTIYYE